MFFYRGGGVDYASLARRTFLLTALIDGISMQTQEISFHALLERNTCKHKSKQRYTHKDKAQQQCKNTVCSRVL